MMSLLARVDRNNRKWAEMNMDIIYKDNPIPKTERERIIREVFRSVGRFAVEYLQIGRITEKNWRKFARYDGLEKVDQALAAGKGVLVVTAHFGNWELLGSISAKIGYNVGAIINRQFNPFSDAWMRRIREKGGKVACFYNEISDISRIVKHLRKNGVVALVADQTYYFQPIFVPFFGMPSATADGPAKFHLKYGAPIVMAFSIRQPDGTYLFHFEDPKSFAPTGNMEADLASIMTWINSRYEEYIRKYPEQWFSLFHGRWERTKPEDFADVEWDPW
jgi:KDO2-lipid IV(A) lauroyltransferase